jgi:hypothetical protein
MTREPFQSSERSNAVDILHHDAAPIEYTHVQNDSTASQLTRICRSRAIFRIVLLVLALALFSAAAFAEKIARSGTEVPKTWLSYIAEASQRFSVPAQWIHAVMERESHGDWRTLSPKGAIGLMQIMPKTYAELRLQFHLGDDPYKPHDNILAGAAYLREMNDHYGPAGFLAAYNAGPSRYEDYLAGRRPILIPAQNNQEQQSRTSRNGFSPRVSPFEKPLRGQTQMLFPAITTAFGEAALGTRTIDLTAFEPSANRELYAIDPSGKPTSLRDSNAARKSFEARANALFAPRSNSTGRLNP